MATEQEVEPETPHVAFVLEQTLGRRAAGDRRFDAMFVHTQVPAVIPLGVDPATWARSSAVTRPDERERILFVGGDPRRKGGVPPIEAFRVLRDDPTLPEVELHLVTGTAVPDAAGVTKHTDLQPNSGAGDVEALTSRRFRLVADASLRRRLGGRAAEVVSERVDAAKNASALVRLLAETARGGPP